VKEVVVRACLKKATSDSNFLQNTRERSVV